MQIRTHNNNIPGGGCPDTDTIRNAATEGNDLEESIPYRVLVRKTYGISSKSLFYTHTYVICKIFILQEKYASKLIGTSPSFSGIIIIQNSLTPLSS